MKSKCCGVDLIPLKNISNTGDDLHCSKCAKIEDIDEDECKHKNTIQFNDRLWCTDCDTGPIRPTKDQSGQQGLPNDEEIEQAAKSNPNTKSKLKYEVEFERFKAFKIGASWMREEIKRRI